MAQDMDVPWLDDNEIESRATVFLARVHPEATIPVPIELIVERDGIDIVPIERLQADFDMEGCTSADRRTIFVDRWVSECRENRYRFTLAHEMGHVILHAGLFDNLRRSVSTVEAWRELHAGSLLDYGRIEWQANTFAGRVLVPTRELVGEYQAALPAVRALIARSVQEGHPREKVLGYAWSRLHTLLCQRFVVSEQVVRIRLESEGYAPSQL